MVVVPPGMGYEERFQGQLDLPAGVITPDSPAEDLARVKPCAKGKKIVMSNLPKSCVP